MRTGVIAFNRFTNLLRGIKTPEEISLLKKSIWISAVAHADLYAGSESKNV